MPDHGSEIAALTSPDVYPDWFEMTARFADLDMNWHINNVALCQYFEEARVSMRRRRFADPELGDTGKHYQYVVVSVRTRFLSPVRYPANVRIGTALTRLGGSSYTLVHGLFDNETCAALGRTVTVLCDAKNGKPISLPEPIRSGLETTTVIDESVVKASDFI